MDSAHRMRKYANSLAPNLKQVIHFIGKRDIVNWITPQSPIKYFHIKIRWVNKYEPKAEGQKITSRKVMIKVSGLIHKRSNKSNIIIAWLMFQNIYLMYQEINEK